MKKIISIAIILIIFLGGIVISIKSNAVSPINTANLYSKGYFTDYLRLDGMKLVFNYVVYQEDGVEYPAYCLNKDLPGVEVGSGYTVSIANLVTNVKVWRAITNGYPYKTFSELGCNSAEEAYFATKQAVYCMLYDRDPNLYSASDERSKRVLNALKQIVSAAKNSTASKISSKLTIKEEKTNWEIDSINKKYVSKEFTVSSDSTINNYVVSLQGNFIEGTKIVDINNSEKITFNSEEKFKVLIPIQNMNSEGEFILKVQGKVDTKPILYGKSGNSGYQDYALAYSKYEYGDGEKVVKYGQNKTKIVIIKKEEGTNKPLENVEFQLLNENKDIVYTDLKTNEEGKIIIENVIPGVYYLKEIATTNGYGLLDEDIKVETKFNETVTITVNNSKEEIQIEAPEAETELNVIVKLPKTGR